MIDWPAVAFNALWIVGCALILAALGHAHWLAQARNTYTRKLLSTPAYQLPFSIGLALISGGLFFLSQGWLEHALWAVLTITETFRVLKILMLNLTNSPSRDTMPGVEIKNSKPKDAEQEE